MTTHILLVEDDDDMRQVIAFFLTEEGYHVTQAADGETAIHILATNHPQGPPFDIVITDIVMGDIDGIAVMNAAKKQPLPPEVILFTGHGSLDTAISAVRAGAFDYLLKPCDLQQLLACVQSASAHRDEEHVRIQEAEVGLQIASFVRQLYDESDQRQSQAVPPPSETVSLPPPPVSQSSPDPATEQRYMDVGKLRIDTFRHEVLFDGEPIHVSPTEYGLLAYLATIPGRVATFADIARNTRNYQIEESEARDLVRGPIRNLRRKFDRRYLVSVRGIGFMLVDPEEDSSLPPESTVDTP